MNKSLKFGERHTKYIFIAFSHVIVTSGMIRINSVKFVTKSSRCTPSGQKYLNTPLFSTMIIIKWVNLWKEIHTKYAMYCISDIKFVFYAFELPSIFAF